jgi:hypothetical protein
MRNKFKKKTNSEREREEKNEITMMSDVDRIVLWCVTLLLKYQCNLNEKIYKSVYEN